MQGGRRPGTFGNKRTVVLGDHPRHVLGTLESLERLGTTGTQNVLATHKCTFTPAALLGLERATVTFASVRLHITAVVQATLPIPVNYETKYQLTVLLRRRRVFFNDNRLQMAGVGIFTKFHSAGFTFCFGL